MRFYGAMKPIVARIEEQYPSLRIELKPDPRQHIKGYRVDRIELWTPFMHVELATTNPTT